MADETITYEQNGHQFQFKVPKGSDDDFVHKAAQLHYNTKYATESGPVNPVLSPPVIQTPEFQGMEKTGDEGFLKSTGKAFGNIIHHPIDTIAAFMPATEQRQLTPEQADSGKFDPFDSEPDPTLFKALHGNIPGAIGDITPQIVLAIAGSPKMRNAVEGFASGASKAASDTNINVRRSSLPAVVGGAIGAHGGGWPGFLTGSSIGALAPEIPRVINAGVRQGSMNAAVEPWFPSPISNVPEKPIMPAQGIAPPPRVNVPPYYPPSEQSVNIPKAISQGRVLTPEAPIQHPELNPAPIITPQPQVQPPKLLGPATEDFWKGPGSKPIKPPETPSTPKVENQQVPASVSSIDTPLPGSKPVVKPPEDPSTPKVAGSPEDPSIQKAKNIAKKANEKFKESQEIKKPHFTHEIIGNIAKSMSDNKTKVSMTEVGRYIHEHDIGTYEPSKFGDGKFGSGRSTKGEPPDPNTTKNAKEQLIGEGIKKFISNNGHLF